MGKLSRKKGSAGETIAANYLAQKGFQLICKNYFTRYGEIDLVMKENKTLVFVEVKFGREGKCGKPLEWITKRKINRFVRAAKEYISRNNLYDIPVRIDFVAILQTESGLKITHIPNAFGEQAEPMAPEEH